MRYPTMGHSNLLVMDAKAAPERALLASVVSLAIADACAVPPDTHRKEEHVAGLRIRTETFTAMRFLFDERVSGLSVYAEWLDFDAGQFRRRLLALMANDSAMKFGDYDPMRRRNFRYNHRLWLQLRNMETMPEEPEEEEDETVTQ